LINYKINKGKGFALKKGIEKAKYDWILTSDSDLSVSSYQLLIWINKKLLSHNNHIYFGSRNLPESIVKKKRYRKIIGIIFTFIIWMFFKIKLKDTQCGFKLYRSKYAKKIFKKIITNGYMHDIEICLISEKLNVKITELPVKWTHKNNSKISLFRDVFKILYSLFIIKINEY
jgi:dolichyl-phosphate beta-glucosyltransferase